MPDQLQAASPDSQYGRKFALILSNKQQAAVDLSAFRCTFQIKRNGVMTPNVATIRIYNLDFRTALTLKKEFTQVTLQAGYESNFGVIFKGNIKQAIPGRENATDTYLELTAGDGDQAYNYAIVNASIAAGSSPADHLNAAAQAMASQGVKKGNPIGVPTAKLPRGKVLYGNARDVIHRIAESAGADWSIQDEEINFLPTTTYKRDEVVVLSSKSGMIGTPRQTTEGINFRCLLNPKLKIHCRVQVDNKSVEQYRINFSVPGSRENTPVPLTLDGVYYIFSAEHSGDTRGNEWYTDLVTLTTNAAPNPINAIQTGA